MTTPSQVKARPKARVGDIALLPAFGSAQFFRIMSVETDEAGNASAYYLAGLTDRGPGQRVEPNRIVAIFTNVLN